AEYFWPCEKDFLSPSVPGISLKPRSADDQNFSPPGFLCPPEGYTPLRGYCTANAQWKDSADLLFWRRPSLQRISDSPPVGLHLSPGCMAPAPYYGIHKEYPNSATVSCRRPAGDPD